MVAAALIWGTAFALNADAREVAVLLLRPAHASGQASEAIVRLRGELLAAGYAVELADVPDHGSVRTAMEPPARPAGVDAVVALFGDAPQGPGLLWVIDRATGKTVTRPIPHDSEGARGAQILAVRALELLRASFLEVAMTPPPKTTPAPPLPPRRAVAAAPSPVSPSVATSEMARAPAAPPEAAAREASAPPAPRETEAPEPTAPPVVARAAAPTPGTPARLALEAGGLVLGSLDGVPPAVLPLLRATLLPARGWPLSARLTVAGLGTRARVDSAQGEAQVSHQLALAEALWVFRRGRRWQPFVSVGAGAVYVSAQGSAAGGGAGERTASTWAFVADMGAGLHVGLGQHLSLGGEVHVEGDAPYPAVRYLGSPLATEGRPTLLGTLSLMAWL